MGRLLLADTQWTGLRADLLRNTARVPGAPAVPARLFIKNVTPYQTGAGRHWYTSFELVSFRIVAKTRVESAFILELRFALSRIELALSTSDRGYK